MNSKNFRFNLILRSLVLTLFALALVYCVLKTEFYVVTFLCLLGLIIVLAEMVHYVDKTNRDLAIFLLSIKHDDYSTTFTEQKKGRSFSRMYQGLNEITVQFQRIRAEKETQYQLLQTMMEHVDVGLICFDLEGEIMLMNQAFKRMIHKPYLKNIQSLDTINQDLYHTFNALHAGDRELLKINIQEDELQLSLQTAEFKLQNRPYKLISLQDIRGELEAQELESWQKLIRILTHEIMNSVTPVISLAETLQDMLHEDEALEDTETLEDIRAGIDAIRNRGTGLLHFTENYRDLTRIPQPELQQIELKPFLERVHTLFKAELAAQDISLEIKIPNAQLSVEADPKLIEQVFINLIQNAIDALGEKADARIEIQAHRSAKGKVLIDVRDNAGGIPKNIQEKIFVPFFSTKEKGSGIGLSLSRQIVRLHKGELKVHTLIGEGTVFTVAL